MNLADLRAAVRAETDNDEDTQITDAQLNTWFWVEYGKVRRRLSARFPELFTVTSDDIVVLSGQSRITKPLNLERLIRIERCYEDRWEAVPHANKVNPHLDTYLGYREHDDYFWLTPADSAPGTYRLIFVTEPETCFPAGDIPRGFEDVIIQKVVAKAQIRIGGDPSPHITEADTTFRQLAKALTPRKSNAPEPGFVQGFGVGSEDNEWL